MIDDVSSKCNAYTVCVMFLKSVVHYNVGHIFVYIIVKEKTVVVPGVLGALWPCAIFANSIIILFIHLSFVTGALANFNLFQDGF